MKRRSWLVALTVALIAVLLGAFATTAGYGSKARHSAKTIEVFSLWGGSERDAFLKVTAAFTQQTGINVQYTAGRDFITEIRTRLAAGNPPDIAIVPRPGFLATLVHEGVLKSLSSLGLSSAYMHKNYGPAWINLATVGGKLYAVPAKANSKSLIWYRPNVFKAHHFKTPKTWTQLLKLTKTMKKKHLVPWAVGAGPNQSQWTLGDWIESIYARTAGPAKYQALFSGHLPFTDPSVIHAIKLMTQIVNNKYALGGVQGVLGTSFVDGIGDVFGTNAKAQLYMEGGFVGGIALNQVNPSLRAGVTINSFPWPTINPKWGHPLTGAGDLAVAFKNSPEVRRFMKFISTPAAAKVWVSTGAIISPNKLVPGSYYPNLLVRREAAQVASAKVFLFDGDDLMPGSFEDTWCFGLQKIIQNPSTANIKKVESAFQKQIAGRWGS